MIDWDAFKTQIQANPKKMLGFVLGIATCFLLIWMLVVMQSEASGQKSVVVDQSGRLDSLRISLNQPAADSTDIAKQNAVAAENSEERSPFANALPTFLILLAAIGGLWYWIKKGNSDADSNTGIDGDIFSSLGAQEINAGHQISVIKINGEYWVLGTGGSQINLLHRYTEDEWDGPEVTSQEVEDRSDKLFSSILNSKKKNGRSGNNGSQ